MTDQKIPETPAEKYKASLRVALEHIDNDFLLNVPALEKSVEDLKKYRSTVSVKEAEREAEVFTKLSALKEAPLLNNIRIDRYMKYNNTIELGAKSGNTFSQSREMLSGMFALNVDGVNEYGYVLDLDKLEEGYGKTFTEIELVKLVSDAFCETHPSKEYFGKFLRAQLTGDNMQLAELKKTFKKSECRLL